MSHGFHEMVVKIADTREELQGAFRLQRPSIHHALPSTAVIVAIRCGKVIGTTSLFVDSRLGLPSEKRVDVERLKNPGARIGEVATLAGGERVQLAMMKFLYEYAVVYRGLTHLVTAESSEFHDDILLFEKTSGGAFIDLRNWPSRIASRDSELFQYLFRARNDRFVFPDRAYFKSWDPMLTPELIVHFFGELLERADDHAREALRQLYPPEFHAVLPPPRLSRISGPKRREARFAVSCAGELIAASDEPNIPIRVVEVSEGGLRVENPARLGLRESFLMRLKIANDVETTVAVRTVWDSPSGNAGLRVVQSGQAWKDYLAYLTRDLRRAALPQPEECGMPVLRMKIAV